MWRLTIGLALALGLGLAVRADEYGEDINSATDAVGALRLCRPPPAPQH
jgi:hypothetical protein